MVSCTPTGRAITDVEYGLNVANRSEAGYLMA
jgi:hypothetical protein